MLPLLLPDPGLCLERVEISAQAVILCLRSTAPSAPCPRCSQPASQIHSRYLRAVRDLPIQSRPALLCLTARRFFCSTADCRQRVFCERFPGLLAKHAQATARLHTTHRDLGLALGGEPGARLAAKLGMPTSPDTLLRRVKQLPSNRGTPAPRAVGVDDWALRKGHTYGTILIDLERSVVLDLLPDRDGVALKAWLGQHPEIEVLSRDRWAAYAEAATEAAPQAKQVADRWHLLKNLREALERFLERYAGKIAEAFAASAQPAKAQPPDPGVVQDVVPPPASDSPVATTPETPAETSVSPVPQRPVTAKQQRRRERYQEVRRRQAEGQSLRHIARALRLSRNTVLRYVRAEQCPDWRPGRTVPTPATRYREQVDAWLAAGSRNVAELHRQLQTEDSTLKYDVLRRFVSRRLVERGEWRGRLNAAQPPPPPTPSAKGLSFAVIARPDKRTETQGAHVARLRALDVGVAETVNLVEGFAAPVRKQGETTLTDWQEKARTGASVELRRFAEGLGREQAAVEAALTEAWSNGPVEGHINRLKTIKRQMYGRAGLALLRARVVHAR